jgi:hypothetical protein
MQLHDSRRKVCVRSHGTCASRRAYSRCSG